MPSASGSCPRSAASSRSRGSRAMRSRCAPSSVSTWRQFAGLALARRAQRRLARRHRVAQVLEVAAERLLPRQQRAHRRAFDRRRDAIARGFPGLRGALAAAAPSRARPRARRPCPDRRTGPTSTPNVPAPRPRRGPAAPRPARRAPGARGRRTGAAPPATAAAPARSATRAARARCAAARTRPPSARASRAHPHRCAASIAVISSRRFASRRSFASISWRIARSSSHSLLSQAPASSTATIRTSSSSWWPSQRASSAIRRAMASRARPGQPSRRAPPAGGPAGSSLYRSRHACIACRRGPAAVLAHEPVEFPTCHPRTRSLPRAAMRRAPSLDTPAGSRWDSLLKAAALVDRAADPGRGAGGLRDVDDLRAELQGRDRAEAAHLRLAVPSHRSASWCSRARCSGSRAAVRRGRPAWDPAVPRGQRILAASVHGLLLALLVLIPWSGWTALSALADSRGLRHHPHLVLRLRPAAAAHLGAVAVQRPDGLRAVRQAACLGPVGRSRAARAARGRPRSGITPFVRDGVLRRMWPLGDGPPRS